MLRKIIETLKLWSPICVHEWGRDEVIPIIKTCNKCDKQMFGNTVVKQGDWRFKR